MATLSVLDREGDQGRENCAFGSMRASRGSHPGEIAQNGLLILADDLTNRELVGSPSSSSSLDWLAIAGNGLMHLSNQSPELKAIQERTVRLPQCSANGR